MYYVAERMRESTELGGGRLGGRMPRVYEATRQSSLGPSGIVVLLLCVLAIRVHCVRSGLCAEPPFVER